MNVRAASGIRRDHPRFIGPFPSSVRSSSASLRGVLGIRRTPLQHIDPRPRPGWNPSVKLRSASKLRRARHRTITSHRSPAKPSNKRPGHVKTPKSPSLTHQLEVELRVEPSDERRARLQPPKRPLTGRRLAFQSRGTFHLASKPPQSSEELISNQSTSLPAPRNRSSSVWPTSSLRRDLPQVVDSTPSSGWNLPTGVRATSALRRTHQQHIDQSSSPVGLSVRRPRHRQAPKNPRATRRPAFQLRVEPSGWRQNHVRTPKSSSAAPRPAIQLRGTAHRASGPHPASEETFRRSSTRLPAPGGVHQRVSEPHPGSEEPRGDSSTRIRTPGNSSQPVKLMSGSRRIFQQAIGHSELPKNTSTNARSASEIRRHLQQSVVSLPRTQRVPS